MTSNHKLSISKTLIGWSVFCLVVVVSCPSIAVTRTWSPNGFDDNWFNISNWSPNGSPDSGDDVSSNIFSVPIKLFSGSTNSVNSLTLSAGADLEVTSSGKLVVSNSSSNATISIADIGSRLSIDSIGNGLEADVVSLTDRGELHMGSSALISRSISVSALSTISGFGSVELLNTPSSSSPLLTLDGTIRPSGGNLSIFAPSGGAIDLDGTSGSGFLDLVNGSLLVDAFIPSNDAFGGTARVGSGHELRVFGGFEFDTTSELNFIGGTTTNPAQVHSNLTGLLGNVNVDGIASFRGPAIIKDNGLLVLPGSSDVVTFHDDLMVFGEPSAAAVGRGKIIVGLNSEFTAANSTSLPVEVELAGDLHILTDGVTEAPYGEVEFGNYLQTITGVLNIDLVEFLGQPIVDQVNMLGTANLGGSLVVSLPEFDGETLAPEQGDEFTFLTADLGVSGKFDNLQLPTLSSGLSWHIQYNNNDVTLEVIDTIIGDYNSDGIVNAADYSVWLHNLGVSIVLPGDTTPGTVNHSDYVVWKNNFGNTSLRVSSFGAASGVPEPCTMNLIFLGLLIVAGHNIRHLWENRV